MAIDEHTKRKLDCVDLNGSIGALSNLADTDEFRVRLTRSGIPNTIIVRAEVAELADALGSGSSGLKLVGVRVPPSAPEDLQHFSDKSQRKLPILIRRHFARSDLLAEAKVVT
jgi:hypothetical protein